MCEPTASFIALGSNLGDRDYQIRNAVRLLDEHPEIEVSELSDLIETEPLGPGRQPKYLNAAAALRTTLSAGQLLECMLGIERRLGRDRAKEQRWGPRLIDLDLLLHGDQIVDTPGLTVPHPSIHERPFVLVPLAEIAPDVVHPVLGLTVAQLLRRLQVTGG